MSSFFHNFFKFFFDLNPLTFTPFPRKLVFEGAKGDGPLAAGVFMYDLRCFIPLFYRSIYVKIFIIID